MRRHWRTLNKGTLWCDLEFTFVCLPSLRLSLEGDRRRWGSHTASSPGTAVAQGKSLCSQAITCFKSGKCAGGKLAVLTGVRGPELCVIFKEAGHQWICSCHLFDFVCFHCLILNKQYTPDMRVGVPLSVVHILTTPICRAIVPSPLSDDLVSKAGFSGPLLQHRSQNSQPESWEIVQFHHNLKQSPTSS